MIYPDKIVIKGRHGNIIILLTRSKWKASRDPINEDVEAEFAPENAKGTLQSMNDKGPGPLPGCELISEPQIDYGGGL